MTALADQAPISGFDGAENRQSGRRAPSLFDPEAVKALKARDNVTNWLYLAQLYAIIAATIALALWGRAELAAHGFSWPWTLALYVAAVIAVGASQHQLGGVIHEGTHFLLFRNRRLNEIASDWLGAFPIYTSTYQFRVHHLAHHQFVNDEARDPDIAQLKESGHWLDFPVPHIELLWAFLKRLSPWRLVRYTLTRARYSAVGFDGHAYVDPAQAGSPWPLRTGIIFAVAMPALLSPLAHFGYPVASAAVLVLAYAATMAYLALTPERDYPSTRLEPVISHRATLMARVTYVALLYGTISALQLSGAAGPTWRYFLLYWIVPLFTTFPIFMMLRQWVQHGNADRGRYTNTRVFLVGPMLRYAVFPWGMDYHLPHHLMASVPHYNLKRLHELMLADPTYREKGAVIDGFFTNDGALAALGPGNAPKGTERAYVDNATLEYAEVNDAAAIAREAEASERTV